MQEDDMLSKMEEYFHILHLGEKSLDLGKILSSDTSIKILEVVYNDDADVGLSASDISEVLEVGRTTVIYHLGRMQERGLVKINPVLEDDVNWKKFYDLYRKKSIDVSKEQFNKLHTARMNGIKLFIPTKKGFLVLPSTDVKAGQSMVKEALTSITAPVLEGDYRKMAKSTSIFGLLGILCIAFSFLLPGLPFFQVGGGAMEKTIFTEDASYAAAPATSGPPATMAPTLKTSTELSSGGYGVVEEEEGVTNVGEPLEQPTTQLNNETVDRISSASRALSYAGTLLLGSVLGFLLYSYIRRK